MNLKDLPGIKKLPSTVFGLASLPLVAWFTGLVAPELVICPFGVLCWVAALLTGLNDIGSALVRKMGENQRLVEAIKTGTVRVVPLNPDVPGVQNVTVTHTPAPGQS